MRSRLERYTSTTHVRSPVRDFWFLQKVLGIIFNPVFTDYFEHTYIRTYLFDLH